MKLLLPPSLLPLLLLLSPTLSIASPQPALVSPANTHLVPLHTLFLRQLSNLQTFTQALGGIPAPPITASGDAKKPFEVNGEQLTDFRTAADKSCEAQSSDCNRAANRDKAFTVGECDAQKSQCKSTQDSATVKDFQTGAPSQNIGADPNFPDFDLICDA